MQRLPHRTELSARPVHASMRDRWEGSSPEETTMWTPHGDERDHSRRRRRRRRTDVRAVAARRRPQPAALGRPLGTVASNVTLSAAFDGWGSVHLIDAQALLGGSRVSSVDQYAIPEAMGPDFASGFGTLSVHEVAADLQHASLA